MWRDLTRAMRRFPTAVLSWPDDAGYPTSVRVTPQPDDSAQVVRVDAPAGIPLRPGVASLMSHSHDEQTWHLTSFMCRGRLEQDDRGWVFRPTAFLGGAGIGGPIAQIRYITSARATAKHFLERRSLPRPQVPWDQLNASH